jgi:alpha-glucosidase
MFFHYKGKVVGRDGCRVPLPWSSSGSALGFGPDGSKPHLPQPDYLANYAVEKQEGNGKSTLAFYRKALGLRRQLQGPEELEWVGENRPGLLHFSRPGGWNVVLNLGEEDVKIDGEVLISSAPLAGDVVPQDVCVWYKAKQ